MKNRYSQGVMSDGPVILEDGDPMTPEEIVSKLNELHETIAWLKNEFWSLSNHTIRESDRVIEECSRVIGKSD